MGRTALTRAAIDLGDLREGFGRACLLGPPCASRSNCHTVLAFRGWIVGVSDEPKPWLELGDPAGCELSSLPDEAGLTALPSAVRFGQPAFGDFEQLGHRSLRKHYLHGNDVRFRRWSNGAVDDLKLMCAWREQLRPASAHVFDERVDFAGLERDARGVFDGSTCRATVSFVEDLTEGDRRGRAGALGWRATAALRRGAARHAVTRARTLGQIQTRRIEWARSSRSLGGRGSPADAGEDTIRGHAVAGEHADARAGL